MRDTFVQETGLEFVLSILGAGVGAFASFFLAFFVLRPFDVDYGLDVMAFLAMFLGAPAGSLLGMSLVGKVVHRSWSCSWRALIFTFVACDLALAVLRIMPPGDSGTFAGPEFLFLIAGVCAFLGYKLSGIKRAESRHPTTDTIGTDTIGTDPRSPE